MEATIVLCGYIGIRVIFCIGNGVHPTLNLDRCFSSLVYCSQNGGGMGGGNNVGTRIVAKKHYRERVIIN